MRRPKADVVGHAHVREQCITLEHRVHRAPIGRHVLHRLAADQQACRWMRPRSRRSGSAWWSCRTRSAPSSEKNSPWRMLRSTPCSATVAPKRLDTPRSSTAGSACGAAGRTLLRGHRRGRPHAARPAGRRPVVRRVRAPRRRTAATRTTPPAARWPARSPVARCRPSAGSRCTSSSVPFWPETK